MNSKLLLLTNTFAPITETSNYISRVEADGGTIGNPQKLDLIFRALVDNSMLSSVEQLYSRFGGYKESGGTITKLYDLGDNDVDVISFNTAPSLASGGVGFTAGTYWNSPSGDRSLSEWSYIIWGKPDIGTNFMGVAGDSNAHESLYLNTNNDNMYYIDSNYDFNAIGGVGATMVGNWNFYSWWGDDSIPEVQGFMNGSYIGNLDSSEGLDGFGDGRFRDERVMTFSGNNFSGDIDVFGFMNVAYGSTEFTSLFNQTKGSYGY